MLSLGGNPRVFLCVKPVDFRNYAEPIVMRSEAATSSRSTPLP